MMLYYIGFSNILNVFCLLILVWISQHGYHQDLISVSI